MNAPLIHPIALDPDVPDWLLPAVVQSIQQHPLAPVTTGHPIDQSDDSKWSKSETNRMRTRIRNYVFEAIFERAMIHIAAGQPLRNFLQDDHRRPNMTEFIAWVYKDPNRRALYHEAKAIGAEIIEDDMMVISDAQDSAEDVARSTLRINTRKWLLGVWNRDRYGEKKTIDQNVTINLQEAMQEASRRLGRTYDASVERIDE